jgi:hypothetical protein
MAQAGARPARRAVKKIKQKVTLLHLYCCCSAALQPPAASHLGIKKGFVYFAAQMSLQSPDDPFSLPCVLDSCSIITELSVITTSNRCCYDFMTQ